MKELIEELYAKKTYFDLSRLSEELAYGQEFKIDNHTFTFLHLAAIRNPKVLKKVLEFKPSLNHLIEIPLTYSTSFYCQFATPLMYALMHGHKENAELLIQAGADLNIRCPISFNTALSLAIYGQQWDLASHLLLKGASTPLQERHGNLSILEKVTQVGIAPDYLREQLFSSLSFPSFQKLYPQGDYKHFTWRILPEELLQRLQREENFEEALKIEHKRIKSIIFSKALKEYYIHFPQISFYFILSSLNFNYDHLCTLMEKIDLPLAHSWSSKRIKSMQQSIKVLQAGFTQKSIVRFLVDTYQEFDIDLELTESMWEDLYGMFLTIEHNHRNIVDYLPKKLKTLTELHDHFAMRLARESQRDFVLAQEDLILTLHEMKFKNFIIKVPKMNHDLIDIGIQMSICVGSGLYGEKINETNSQIFTLTSEAEGLQYCVEIDPHTKEVVQAKGPYNESMPSSLVEELQSFLNYRLWWKGREGT